MFKKLKLKKQMKTLQKEVDNGNAQAMFDLAIIYLESTLIKNNFQKGNQLMQQSANLGCISAKTYLTANKITKGVNVVTKAINEIKNIK